MILLKIRSGPAADLILREEMALLYSDLEKGVIRKLVSILREWNSLYRLDKKSLELSVNGGSGVCGVSLSKASLKASVEIEDWGVREEFLCANALMYFHTRETGIFMLIEEQNSLKASLFFYGKF